MEQFDINKIIKYYKLNTEDLAKALYPAVKYPKQAFDRVLKGEADLSVKQVEMLASYAGVLISDLFSVNTWKGSFEDNCLIMQKGDYKVRFNYNGAFMTIYKNNRFVEQKIVDTCHMSLYSVMAYLDECKEKQDNLDNSNNKPTNKNGND